MEHTKVILLIALCVFALTPCNVYCQQADAVALAQKWAPKIYLYSKEEFWPGDVELFLKQVVPVGDGCQAGNGLPTGPQSQKCFLTIHGSPYDLLSDKKSFLYGTKDVQSVPAYAYVKTCAPDHFVISYWIFFPFNKGKEVIGLVKMSSVLRKMGLKTKKPVIGNHVGDWEHMSVELKGGQPVSMYLSVHSSGIYYDYDQSSNTFKMTSTLKGGVKEIPNPPQTIRLEGGHPVLYCAQGSHAVWAAEGRFSYSQVKLKDLTDVTDQGPEWDTWKTLQVFHSANTTPAWWFYDGRWGNQGFDCIMDMYCIFSDGPWGLSTRPEDYQC